MTPEERQIQSGGGGGGGGGKSPKSLFCVVVVVGGQIREGNMTLADVRVEMSADEEEEEEEKKSPDWIGKADGGKWK